jgi:prepilin-type N-terminal cleavage/methylation domain-containing protein
MKTHTLGRRTGFTLIELLAVIAIVAALLALTVGTYFRVRNTQENKTAEAMVGKIGSALDRHTRAVVDQASEEFRYGNIPNPLVLSLIAGGDPNRARILYIKLRIKQEFPATFAEALAKTPVDAAQIGPVTIGGTPYTYSLPAKAIYFQKLKGGTGLTSVGAAEDSAACLRMAMGVARRGESELSEESIGAQGNTTIAYGSVTLPVYSDTWGRPIGFCRWPTGCVELSSAPYSGADPQDPENLLNAGWLNTYSPADQVTIVSQLHPLAGQGVNRNMVPVAISLGLNGKPDKTAAQWKTLNDSGGTAADDNIYSYRLRR